MKHLMQEANNFLCVCLCVGVCVCVEGEGAVTFSSYAVKFSCDVQNVFDPPPAIPLEKNLYPTKYDKNVCDPPPQVNIPAPKHNPLVLL